MSKSTADESHSIVWKLLIFSYFHQALSATVISTDVSQVDYVYVYNWEKLRVGWKLLIFSSFHWALSATVMSTDVSQVRVTLFPSFKHFISFYLSRFSFYVNYKIKFPKMTLFYPFIYDTNIQTILYFHIKLQVV